MCYFNKKYNAHFQTDPEPELRQILRSSSESEPSPNFLLTNLNNCSFFKYIYLQLNLILGIHNIYTLAK